MADREFTKYYLYSSEKYDDSKILKILFDNTKEFKECESCEFNQEHFLEIHFERDRFSHSIITCGFILTHSFQCDSINEIHKYNHDSMLWLDTSETEKDAVNSVVDTIILPF